MENGRSARILIGALGSIVAVLAVVVAIVIFSGNGDSAAAEPSVTIEDAYAVGNDAVVEFTVDNGGETTQVSIDWGDGSSPLVLSGHGPMSASHTYSGDEVEPVVTITMTATGGAVLTASRQIILNDVGPADTSTTTTDDDGDPGGTTTTTTAPATTTTTTTTTAPQRETVEIPLDPLSATFNQGSGAGTASFDDARVRMYLRQDGFNPSVTRTATVTWTFRAADLGLLAGGYEIDVLMNPNWEVYLWTGPNPGRTASWSFGLIGLADGDELDRREVSVAIAHNEEEETGGRRTLNFITPVPDGWDEVTLRLRLTCAVEAGSNPFQIGESSICDARDAGRGFTIGPSRIRFVPVD